MQKQGILKSSVNCPGPLVQGKRLYGCGKPMQMKKTNDSMDSFVWRCRKVHKVIRNNIAYIAKDVKLSIGHHSWLVDSKITLEIVLELIYLWSQGFTQAEIIHELKVSNKTVTEWTNFFRESCISTVLHNSTAIGGNGIEVEIDEARLEKENIIADIKLKGSGYLGDVKNMTKQKYL